MKHKRMSVKTTLNIIGILFFIIGLIFFISGCFLVVSNNNFKNNSEVTEAEIIDINYYRKYGDTHRRPVIRYNVNGKEYEQQLDEYNTGMYKGKKIKVYYDPENPGDVRTGSSFLPIFIVCFGGLFMILGSIFVFINLNSLKRRKYLMKNGDVFTGTIIDVKINYRVSINRRHPYKAECEVIDPYTNERYLYSSENIVDDISELVGSSVTVYVDKNNKGKYYVDINELINDQNVHDYR